MSPEERLARLQQEMTRPPFHHWLAPEAVKAEKDRIEIRLPAARPEFCHSLEPALIHGGVIAALIDIAGYAVVAVEQESPAPTISMTIEFLRPAPATELTALAILRRLGRSVAHADIEIRADDKLVALGRGTFAAKGEKYK
jgi:uncharacterized protein (TIGR00369 family)